jgi:hypothetical protein
MTSLYETVMGADYLQLAPALQAFHRLAGRHELHGEVETEPPRSTIAKLLALGLGTPTTASRGAIRFELDAGPAVETWTRHFPSRRMSSRLQLGAKQNLVERLGPARLEFDLLAAQGKLVMRLRSLHFLGVPCPAWLMPRIVAEETGEGARLHFDVEAALPLLGVVTKYRGHLQVPGASS